ncbi:substrate-binding domain-containing protein [Vibrio sp. ZSDZ65]|uniref:Substrate-binding domain-containing protein n=1 Tax=Vibrio qingdaonensis TaxID=2829491 RepID=A0A9X3CRX7_9VIBR|nr:substrate-binding domain-containing protein [Vibrio qingdaonensis]MCW8348310.1 substrate-binding domain-containing protein [Vibrio qingdaonensis]
MSVQKMSAQKATIYDVAKWAGVSASTVSRYLNRTSFIAKDKVDAIELAIFETGFKHKSRKGEPDTKRNMTIGVIVPSFDAPYVSRILLGMDEQMHKHSYDLIIETTNWDIARERSELNDLVSRQVDGVIIIGGELVESEIAQVTADIPALLMCRSGSGLLPMINVDNEIGAYLATNHLLQLGHSKIFHAMGARGNIETEQRLAGFKRAMTAAGLPSGEPTWISANFEPDEACQRTIEKIESGAEFTAVFAANDLSAFGVIQALHRKGLRVPEDVSVIGFDDLPIGDFYIPRLSTMRQPFAQMGEIAIRYLLDLISGNRPDYDIPPVSIVVRDSTSSIALS